jgi:uncharacterized OB-fold protein
MTSAPASRPLPTPDERSQPFFDGAARGVLMLQRCRQCSAWHWPVREVCSECLSTDLEWAQASGRGTVHSFGVMHRVFHPGFADAVPYNLAVVELDEGPRTNSNLVGVDNEAIRVGMRVIAQFDEDAPGVFVPRFRPE